MINRFLKHPKQSQYFKHGVILYTAAFTAADKQKIIISNALVRQGGSYALEPLQFQFDGSTGIVTIKTFNLIEFVKSCDEILGKSTRLSKLLLAPVSIKYNNNFFSFKNFKTLFGLGLLEKFPGPTLEWQSYVQFTDLKKLVNIPLTTSYFYVQHYLMLKVLKDNPTIQLLLTDINVGATTALSLVFNILQLLRHQIYE